MPRGASVLHGIIYGIIRRAGRVMGPEARRRLRRMRRWLGPRVLP